LEAEKHHDGPAKTSCFVFIAQLELEREFMHHSSGIEEFIFPKQTGLLTLKGAPA
jgi:hypothetical protein